MTNDNAGEGNSMVGSNEDNHTFNGIISEIRVCNTVTHNMQNIVDYVAETEKDVDLIAKIKGGKEYFVAFGMDGIPIDMPTPVEDEIDADAAMEFLEWSVKEPHTQGVYTKKWLLEHEYFCESDFDDD